MNCVTPKLVVEANCLSIVIAIQHSGKGINEKQPSIMALISYIFLISTCKSIFQMKSCNSYLKKNPKNIAFNKTYRVQHPKRPVRKAGESFFLHLIYQMDYGLDEITSICVYAQCHMFCSQLISSLVKADCGRLTSSLKFSHFIIEHKYKSKECNIR